MSSHSCVDRNLLSIASHFPTHWQKLHYKMYLLLIRDTWLTRRLEAFISALCSNPWLFLQFWKRLRSLLCFLQRRFPSGRFLTLTRYRDQQDPGQNPRHTLVPFADHFNKTLLFLVPTKINNRMTFNLKSKPINYLFCWKCWYLICLENFNYE